MISEIKKIHKEIFKIIEVDYNGDYSEEEMSKKLETQLIKYVCSEAEAELNIILSNLTQELKKGKNVNFTRINQLLDELKDMYNYSKYSD